MSRKARTRSLSKSLKEGMSPLGFVSAISSDGDRDGVEGRRPLMILQKIQAAIFTNGSARVEVKILLRINPTEIFYLSGLVRG